MGRRGSWTIGRVAGIPIRLHFTFLIILPYIAWAITRSVPALASMAGVLPAGLALPFWALGGGLAVGLFACVLVHELAHVFVGRRGGARFSGVTLMLVGGVSEVVDLPRKPSGEALMALAGPVASLLLGAGFYAAHALAAQPDLLFALYYLGLVNLTLAVFNLVPAFPMDGGRILRALLALVTTRVRATRVAAGVGQAVALLFLSAGVFTFNWVLVLIGILVIGGARAELEMVKSTSALEGLRVEQAMQRWAPTVDANDGVPLVIERMRREARALYFVLSRGELVGVLGVKDLERLGSAPASFAKAGEVMRSEFPKLWPGQDLAAAAREMRLSGLTCLPVLDGERGLVGALTLADVAVAGRDRTPSRRTALRERKAT